MYLIFTNKKISNIVGKAGYKYIITSKKCLTGTDRVAEASKKIKSKIYINVQGDEPICNPSDIRKIIRTARKYPNKVINGFTKIKDKKMFNSPHVPKVIFRKDGNLIYMSRAPIPSNKKKSFIEVKNVTLLRKKGIAEFPDAETLRGSKNLRELIKASNKGFNIYIVYVVQREDCDYFSIAKDIDKEYAKLLTEAVKKKLKIVCFDCKFTSKGISINKCLKFLKL